MDGGAAGKPLAPLRVSSAQPRPGAAHSCSVTVERWERMAEVPLMLLALAFLVAYAWPILDPALSPTILSWLSVLSWTVWGAFVIDLVARLWWAENRVDYAVRHWYDVALVALPMLRPLRLLRVLAVVRILDRSMAPTLVSRMTLYVVGAAFLATGLGGLAMLDAERNAPGANITMIGDALWWAVTTVTTVGYGDRYPVTLQGRLIAVVLMLVGISVVGTVTASIASWFVSRGAETQRDRKAGRMDETAG